MEGLEKWLKGYFSAPHPAVGRFVLNRGESIVLFLLIVVFLSIGGNALYRSVSGQSLDMVHAGGAALLLSIWFLLTGRRDLFSSPQYGVLIVSTVVFIVGVTVESWSYVLQSIAWTVYTLFVLVIFNKSQPWN